MELTEINEWSWIPGNLNVADDATRVKTGPLTSDSRWLKGPDFLYTSNWPTEPTINSSILEMKSTAPKICSYAISTQDSLHPVAADPLRFSSWLRMVRATALAHRFLSLLRIRAYSRSGEIIHHSPLPGKILTFETRETHASPSPTVPNCSRGGGGETCGSL